MPNEENSTPTPPTSSEAEPPKRTFREIAEATYDDLVEQGEAADGDGSPGDGQSSRPRDSLGRFAPKGEEPGEADGDQPTQPRIETQAPEVEPHPAPQGSSSEAPANWSQADREMFGKQTPEAQAYLLRRHSEMEGDYQRRVQATASAAQFTASLAPTFQDPRLAGSLRQNGISPTEAINQWAQFHVRFSDQNPQVRAGVMQELMQRSGLDPAAVFGLHRPELPPGVREDPAIRYITDHIGRTSSEVQSLKQALQQMQANAQAQVDQENLRLQLERIDAFEKETDQNGKLLHPDFADAMPIILDLFRANPQRNLKSAYEQAIWADEKIRERLLSAKLQEAERQQSLNRAKQAVRSNTRGMTSPVAGTRVNGPVGLRATIEAAADEIGYGT